MFVVVFVGVVCVKAKREERKVKMNNKYGRKLKKKETWFSFILAQMLSSALIPFFISM